jgi:hypothetical protein
MTNKLTLALASLLLGTGVASAQEKTEKPAENPAVSARRGPLPLKLQIVYARYLGEKKVSSVPYTLSVNADERPTRLRMGIEVPVQVATKDNVVQFQYRNVGNNLDCSAQQLDHGDRFRVWCTFEQSSIYAAEGERRGASSAIGDVQVGNMPLFRNFRSEANIVLRDGQTAQYTVATDPVSGEVLKIDVTLNVVK